MYVNVIEISISLIEDGMWGTLEGRELFHMANFSFFSAQAI